MEQKLLCLIFGLTAFVALVLLVREFNLRMSLRIGLHNLIEDADNCFTAEVIKIAESDAYSRIWCVVSVFCIRGLFFQKPVYRNVKFYFVAGERHDYYIGQPLDIEAIDFDPQTRVLWVAKVIPQS